MRNVVRNELAEEGPARRNSRIIFSEFGLNTVAIFRSLSRTGGSDGRACRLLEVVKTCTWKLRSDTVSAARNHLLTSRATGSSGSGYGHKCNSQARCDQQLGHQRRDKKISPRDHRYTDKVAEEQSHNPPGRGGICLNQVDGCQNKMPATKSVRATKRP